ncbi:protein kinase [Alloactinosynnema sp. L-07]|uniref:serine/threonine-protein kinase n=1 Tax=Alloactinosynnema sp. L-07 TaxID=1653480 RepID=UPI00065F0B44|nr:serine/threonine-protein kinase [Alloactinosynnema sp. L-07]CRK59808.1 protein kinase [Alloactinosynnema sp. L-07]
MSDAEGQQFGRYRLDGLLGRGGMGDVYRAYDTVLQRDVAVKVLPADLAGDDEFRARFRREAELLSRLQAPHVVPINSFGEIDGQLYLDMPLLPGQDLDKLLAHGPLGAARAVTIIGQVALALGAAHAAGLVHRDVKPSNVLVSTVDGADYVYLLDFGIARSTTGTTSLTRTGMAIGTMDYMSPERFASGRADARSDVYSLACLLYEALTATKPFVCADLPALIHAHLSLPPPLPTVLRPDLPPGFDTTVAIGMAKSPDDRFPTAGALADAARRALSGAVMSPPRPDRPPDPTKLGLPDPPAYPYFVAPAPPPRSRSRVLPWVVAAAILLSAGAGVWLSVLLNRQGGIGGSTVTTTPVATTTKSIATRPTTTRTTTATRTTTTETTTTTSRRPTTTRPTTTRTTTTRPTTRPTAPRVRGTGDFYQCTNQLPPSSLGPEVVFTVANRTDQALTLDYLDTAGVWRPWYQLAAGETFNGRTADGGWWGVRNANGCLSVFRYQRQVIVE